MKRSIMMAVCVLAALLLLSGCGEQKKTVRIGIAGPMTGPDAKMGSDFRNGVAIAVEEWNAKGGVLGLQIEPVIADDQSDPKQAVAVANKLINDKVIGVIGHFNSSCSIPASDVYNRAFLPVITPGSTNPQLTDRGYRGVFRVCGTDDQQGKIGAEFAVKKLNVQRVAILHDKTTYGQGLADFFRINLGPSVEVVYSAGITRGDKDFKTVLTAMREKKPELIFFGGIYAEAGLLIKQAKELNLTAPFLSGDGAIDPKMIEIAGAAAAEGTYLTFSPDPANIPAAKGFIEKYRAKYGELGPYSIYAYVAANVLLDAIKAANSSDGKAITEKLHAMNFPTALGPVKFSDKGNVTEAPFVVWVTRNGKFVEYWKP